MTSYVYDNYCRPDETTLSNHIIGQPAIIDASYIVTVGNQITFGCSGSSFNYGTESCLTIPYIINTAFLPGYPAVTYNAEVWVPVCNSPGPLVTNTEMSFSDAVTVSGSVLTLWALAFAFKSLRRVL